MNPVFGLSVAVLGLVVHVIMVRRLGSDALTNEHRQALQKAGTGRAALLARAVAAVIVLSGAWFAFRNGTGSWWSWLIAGLLFLTNLILTALLRRRVSGHWFEPRETGKRAWAGRLATVAAVSLVGSYLAVWSAGSIRPAGSWSPQRS